jgi:Flp pilus assembly protein TadG
MPSLHQSLRNLVRDERGNVLITFGLTSLVALCAVGGAVDFGRAYQQKSKMQSALDAAVVSAVAKMKETNNNWQASQSHATAVFKGVFANATTGTSAGALDVPAVSFQQSGTQVTGSVVMQTSTPFLKLVTGRDLQVAAGSSAMPPSGKQLELAIMVDVTGSMGWNAPSGAAATACNLVSGTPNTKIEFLQCAAEDLLNIVLPANGSNDSSVKVGIAPFSDTVNAGVYAEKVVDPVLFPATGGAYTPRENLAQTRQGPFTGTYSTAGAQPAGSQFGAMGTVVASGATNTTAGATFQNSYCASPGGTAAPLHTRDGRTYGLRVSASSSWTGNAPTGLIRVPSGGSYARSNRWNLTWGAHFTSDGDDYWYSTTTSGYYVPLVSDPTGLTVRTNNGSPIGVEFTYSGSAWNPAPPAYAVRNTNGYWRVTGINATGALNLSWTPSSNNSYYVPLYQGLITAVTPGCETTTTTSSSKLISCVTERRNGTDVNFTAEAIGAGKYVGPYNHGSSGKSNYSSDGKCWSAGRELPPVIPLTNNRSALTSFFQNITVGGATAGHLGTAWASYLLSPDWANIWPSTSTPAAYSNTGVKKAAVLMTDGQYNIQFSFGSSGANVSAKQALMICKEMRSKGIQVYTVGFGFAANAAPPFPNVEAMSDADRTTPLTGAGYTETQKALDTLAKCASSNASYYFPYDGEALRSVFRNIASSLSSDLNGGKARLTN